MNMRKPVVYFVFYTKLFSSRAMQNSPQKYQIVIDKIFKTWILLLVSCSLTYNSWLRPE